MMKIKFWKVEAAGNDFIMIDYRKTPFRESLSRVAIRLANRRLGIGADGVIFIEENESVDFFMAYYNADGTGPVMCGNGARAALYFVFEYGICRKGPYRFLAADGEHLGVITDGKVSLTIKKIGQLEKIIFGGETAYFINTGVPHFVRISKNVESLDIYAESPDLRKTYDANINYIEKINESRWKIRTYERGVEDETLACGTGATASAMTINQILHDPFPIILQARGGDLVINTEDDHVWLSGPVRKVYEGIIEI
jgi:diaminopimelate epimerase